jgi:CSLREA domain-containing protein
VQPSAVVEMRALLRVRVASAMVVVVALAIMLSTAAYATSYTVTTLDDPTGPSGTCSLRDAITAANGGTPTSGSTCTPPGSGNDTINFSVTGPIALASTLPQITDSKLTIQGPAAPGITLNGGGTVQIMQVGSSATVNLSSLTITNGNTHLGGGINNNGILIVTNSTFSNNSAPSNSGVGGGIFNNGMLTISNSTFFNNSIGGGVGGGIYNFGGTLIVTNSTFSNNSVVGGDSFGSGGGIYNAATLIVTNSTFSNNSAGGGGGGGISNGGTLTITNSTFSNNSASDSGGGGIFNGGTLTVSNSTFSNNSASNSGGVGGGGIYNNGTPVSIESTILADNTSGNCLGAITDEGYNLSDDTSCGFTSTTSQNGVLDTQLKLGPLQTNGGPTQTIALGAGSVAIDAIPLTACTYQNVNPCTNPPTTSASGPLVCDQRGEPRPSPGQNACDIGAFELQAVPFAQFKAVLGIDLPDSFALLGTFVLGKGGTINPATQAVTLTLSSAELAPVTLTIPAGSFKRVLGQYVFDGEVDGVKVAAVISAPVKNSYGFAIGADGLELTGVSNPVTVTLQVVANSGTTTIKALIE